MSSLQSQLESSERKVNHLIQKSGGDSRLDDLELKLSTALNEASGLREELSAVTSRRDHYQSLADEATESLTELSARIDSQRDDMDKAAKERDEKISELETRKRVLEDELHEMDEERVRLEEREQESKRAFDTRLEEMLRFVDEAKTVRESAEADVSRRTQEAKEWEKKLHEVTLSHPPLCHPHPPSAPI